MKYVTQGEAETKRRQAVEFLRRIGKHEDSERFEAMDARQYAEHRGFGLLEQNPERRFVMAKTKALAANPGDNGFYCNDLFRIQQLSSCHARR